METMKPWYLSKTIWGSLVAVAAAILSGLGFDFDEEAQTLFVEAVLQAIAVGASLFAIIGRLTAQSLIE